MNELSEVLKGLTEPQKEAVLHRGSPLLIIAGPGSGKTEVIARRVAHLVQSGVVQPEEVLAVTFTEKAALGLKDRIQQKLPEVNIETMHISTIHSFCADLLRRYRAESVLPKGFRILDSAGQFLVVYSNRKALGLSEIVKGRPNDFFEAVLRTFNLATEELVVPEGLAAWCQESGACGDEKEADLWKEREVIALAYQQYCSLLTEKNLVDFAFLQRHAYNLVQTHANILGALQARYQTILVDEYQDTNAVQERLFGLLAGNGQNLTVVGDDDQSVYRFRGATVRNIQEFPERYPGAKVVKLVHNFRSRNPIVNHSQQVIVHNPARFAKDLQAVRGPGSDVLLVYEHTATEEAGAVANLLYRLRQAGRIGSYRDAVILLRSVRSYASTYVDALQQAGIPYQVIGDASLFQQDEISQLYDLFNFLGTAKEWGDKHLRHPLVGLSEAACAALKAYKGSLLEITGADSWAGMGIADAKDVHRISELLALKQKVLSQEHKSALGVFYDLLAATGCVGRFELNGNAMALSNLGIFSQLVASWDEHGTTRNFYPFREYMEMLRDGGVDPTLPPVEDAVQIMTIHQSKGLEYPVVVVGAAMDGRLPSQHRRDPYELPYHLRASGPPEVDDPHLVDERKLFYVAATRARDLLIVSTADVVNKRGGGPSPFVYEMFGDDLHVAEKFSEEKIQEIESQPTASHGPRPRHSFSQLAYYMQCPVRYKFSVVYGLAVPWLDPVDFGANVHRCLEAIHQKALQGEYVTIAVLPALMDETWLSAPRSQPEQEEAYRKAALRQISRYLQSQGERLPQTTHAETHFSTPVGEHVLIGKIDLIRLGNDGQIEIVDFKTSGSGPEEIEQARLQLSLYALGVEKHLRQPVAHLTVHFLGDERVQTWAWDDEQKAQAQAWLVDLFGKLERQEFPAHVSYCSHCQEFKDICPYAGGML
jgi:DNA helicase-2/ATP-dependent DNA helicase PcrA